MITSAFVTTDRTAQFRTPPPERFSPTTILLPLRAGESLCLCRPRGKEGLASKDRSDPLAVPPIQPIPILSLAPPNLSFEPHPVVQPRRILESARLAPTNGFSFQGFDFPFFFPNISGFCPHLVHALLHLCKSGDVGSIKQYYGI